MTDDTKLAIEACCQATSSFGPRSVRPIGSVQSSNMDRTDRSVQALFGSVGNRFGPSSISCRSGPTPSQKMSVLRIGPDRTETEPRLSIPGFDRFVFLFEIVDACFEFFGGLGGLLHVRGSLSSCASRS